MTELFIEIFCEEIPARMQERAGADLSKALTDGLKKAGLTVEGVQSLTGPRRLVYRADVPMKSPDISDERKGPRVGAPEQALAGFMKAAGLSDISEAEIREDKKGEFYIAKIEKSGRATADIVKELLPAVMTNFPWPKSMKSGAASFRWVRPLQSLICLLGGDVVDMEIGGIKTGRVTAGHRRHGKGPFTVTGFADYRAQLEGQKAGQGHVMLDAQARKDKILSDAQKLCMDAGLELVDDMGLLNEVAGLAEYPNVILGDMDPSFLELPGEVIRLSMRTHQKYFAVRDPKTGHLAPHFVVVANQEAPDGGVAIAKGNSKVLSARLADAQFFQSEDAKMKLEDYYEKLGTVVFHKKLGSIKDKAERVASLARELAPKVGADADAAAQAAKLAKCDLVTNMVIEFTSLEGQIGRLMYEKEGGDKDIALAIEQHYKPKGPSDEVPTNPVAVAVALADKLDTLIGFWAIDEKPTGSKDPFALRRAALGVVRIILENRVRLDLIEDIDMIIASVILGIIIYSSENKKNGITDKEIADARGLDVKIVSEVMERLDDAKIYTEKALNPKKNNSDSGPIFPIDEENCNNLLAFIRDRLKVYLREKGLRHDIIDAILAQGGNDLLDIVNRITALQSFIDTADGANLMAGYKRAANILKAEAKKAKASGETLPEGAPERPAQAEAAALYDALMSASPAIESAIKDENYAEAMQNLAKLRTPIDEFFDHVTVISDDTAVMKNNLRLLLLIRDTARKIADFEAIQS